MARLRGRRRGAKVKVRFYSSMLIRGIGKTQNPKSGWGQPVIIENRAGGNAHSFMGRQIGLSRWSTSFVYMGLSA
jgi:hypothetical protein